MTQQPWKWEPTDRWVRVIFNGVAVADSRRARLMIESPRELDYYFPLEDVQQELLLPSDHTETSGYRGVKRFWHLRVGDQTAENAVWSYDPRDKRPDFTGYVAFKWRMMEHWYEEEEEVFLHPRNPYHRVDMIPSSRRVEVRVDGVLVASTTRPLLVFETGLPTRYYLPPEDVQAAYLTPSATHSYCPYKGRASYHHLVVNGERFEDAIWYYPDPIPESPRLRGKIAFWPEKDRRIQITVV